MQRGEFLKIDIDELENHMRVEFPDNDIILVNWGDALMMDFINSNGDRPCVQITSHSAWLIDVINKYYDFTFNDMMVRHDNEVWFFYS